MKPEFDKHPPLPVFLTVSGQKCVIAGGGTVALRKITDLIESGALVMVIAEESSPAVEHLYEEGKIQLAKRRFTPDDLDGAFLVFAATDDTAVNTVISMAAKERGILVNAVDNPELCNFISGAVVKRGPLRIAVSTSGCSPNAAANVRRDLEQLYTESYGEFIRFAGELRQYILSRNAIPEDKKQAALQWIAEKETYTIYLDSGRETVWEELNRILFSS